MIHRSSSIGCGSVGRLLDGLEVSRPVELDDGDLLALVREVMTGHWEGTFRITKVEGSC